MSDTVLIFSREHGSYWQKNKGGYTNCLCHAGIYTRDEAEKIASGCGPEKRIELCPVPPDHPVLVMAERDKFAADNDRLRRALVSLRNEVSDGRHPDAPVEELKDGIHFEAVVEADTALSAPPPDAVKRYEARVKAEALEDFADEVTREIALERKTDQCVIEGVVPIAALREKAAALRKEADRESI